MAWSAAYTPATEAGLHKLRIEEGATELFMLCIDLGKTTFYPKVMILRGEVALPKGISTA